MIHCGAKLVQKNPDQPRVGTADRRRKRKELGWDQELNFGGWAEAGLGEGKPWTPFRRPCRAVGAGALKWGREESFRMDIGRLF